MGKRRIPYQQPTQQSQFPYRVYGAAYRIPPEHIKAVQSYLDIREINGYSIQYTKFHPSSTASSTVIQNCMIYIGLPSNPQFLGRQDPEDVARVIARSVGPSGKNSEYLFMLEEALGDLAPESGDGDVRDLAVRVRRIMGESSGEVGGSSNGEEFAGEAVGKEMERVKSGESGQPVEEAEKTNSSHENQYSA